LARNIRKKLDPNDVVLATSLKYCHYTTLWNAEVVV